MEKPHKKLDVWVLSMQLVREVYRVTGVSFPKEERFGLMDQVRRAAVSIPSNISEGAARSSKKEFAKFLHIAQGLVSELDTQIEVSRDLGYLDDPIWQSLDGLMERIDKMLTGLIRAQKASPKATSPLTPVA